MAWKTERCSIPDGGEVVCWDLDSTLRSTMHRRHMLPEIRAGLATWVDYSLACADDTPIEGSVALLKLLQGQVWNIAVSGANESALGLTRDWCDQYDVPLDDFILRPDGDHCPNGEWKVKAVSRLRAAGLTVRLFVEDWSESAAYIREHADVPVLGINPFDPGTVLLSREQIEDALRGYTAEEGAFGSKRLAEVIMSGLQNSL